MDDHLWGLNITGLMRDQFLWRPWGFQVSTLEEDWKSHLEYAYCFIQFHCLWIYTTLPHKESYHIAAGQRRLRAELQRLMRTTGVLFLVGFNPMCALENFNYMFGFMYKSCNGWSILFPKMDKSRKCKVHFCRILVIYVSC